MRRMLILDFDGVVADTEPLNYEAWSVMFARELGLRHGGESSELVGLTLDEIFLLWMADLPDVETKERLLALKNEHYFALAGERLDPIAGSVELVRRAIAAGWYTAIVSRSRRVRLLRTLDLIRFPAIFDVVLGYEDGMNTATDHKDHACAARLFGIDPAVCVVVEDSAQGVRDAVESGIGTVYGLTTSIAAEALWAAGATQVVDRLDLVTLR